MSLSESRASNVVPLPTARQRRGAREYPPVTVLSRREFLSYFGESYSPGQHVTFLGPTQRGKTTLAQEMLHEVISPELPCIMLAGKPPGRDPRMAIAAKTLDLRVVETWPPGPNVKPWHKYNGFLLRPHHTMDDTDKDNAELSRQFGKAMRSAYASKKPVILVVDEAHLVQNELKLRKELEAPLMRGAPVVAVWSLIQRGRNVTYLAYNMPEHFLIGFDPDESNRERYAEMGGVDPRYIEQITAELRTYEVPTTGGKSKVTISEFLYIRRSGPEIFVVDVK